MCRKLSVTKESCVPMLLSGNQREKEADRSPLFQRNRHLPSMRLFVQLLSFSCLLSSIGVWEQQALLRAAR